MKKLTTERLIEKCFCRRCEIGHCSDCIVSLKHKIALAARRFVKMEQKQNEVKKLDQDNNLREVEGYPVLNKEKR